MGITVAAIEHGDISCQAVLKKASRLAQGGDLKVLSVFPAPIEWVRDLERSAESRTQPKRGEMRRAIQETLRKMGIEGASVHVPLANSPNMGDDVVAYSHDLGAETIVIGTQGRKGLNALMIGSVAERVVRHAHCDVHVVRAPKS